MVALNMQADMWGVSVLVRLGGLSLMVQVPRQCSRPDSDE